MLRNFAPPLLHASSANNLPSPRSVSLKRAYAAAAGAPRAPPKMRAQPSKRPKCVNDGARARQ